MRKHTISSYLLQKHDDPTGTSLQGELRASYAQLVSLFGRHHYNDGYKSDAEWCFMTPAGVVTIYNYKDGRNYCGRKEGIPLQQIEEWHVGGTNKYVYSIIYALIEGYNNAIINK